MANDEGKPEEAAGVAAEGKAADENAEAKKDSELSAKDAKETAAAPNRGKKRKKKSSLDVLTADSVKVPTSSKRERKTVEHFEAQNFVAEKMESSTFECPKGRGAELSHIESVRVNIKGAKMKGPELNAAHKLVFGGGRGRVKDRARKPQLLQFSGYLPPLQEGINEEEQNKIDEDAEAKMSEKAYKLTIPALKSLCDFFDVDRSAKPGKTLDKDALIDHLLDFLGAPDEKLTKTYLKSKKAKGRKSTTPSKKTIRKKAREGVEDDNDDDETEDEEEDAVEAMEVDEDGKKVPTDKALRKWVRAYVDCFNLDKATTKHALETASDKFGVDLTEKKGRIKELLTEKMVS